MTAFFVKKFKNQNECSACDSDHLSGYKMCASHLKIAREGFMRWANERRAIGKCISCDRNSRVATRGEHKGRVRETRCNPHAKINRQKCARWMALHPTYHRDEWVKRVQLRDAGFCPTCPEHRKLPAGQKRCDFCRIKHSKGYEAAREFERSQLTR